MGAEGDLETKAVIPGLEYSSKNRYKNGLGCKDPGKVEGLLIGFVAVCYSREVISMAWGWGQG